MSDTAATTPANAIKGNRWETVTGLTGMDFPGWSARLARSDCKPLVGAEATALQPDVEPFELLGRERRFTAPAATLAGSRNEPATRAESAFGQAPENHVPP